MRALVYVVDDDPVFSKFLGTQLINNGIPKIEYFENGETCIEKLKKGNKPKFIFLDFSLGSLNGLDVLTAIRKINRTAKVIIVTGINDQELMGRCIENGAVLCLNKETIMQEFPEELTTILTSRSGIFSLFG